MSTFVKATNANGETQHIPEHWLDHPVLGAGFTLSDDQQDERDETQRLAEGPTEDWTIAQLTEYATARGIDLGGAKKHGDIYAAVTAPTYTENPANGGE